MEHFPQIEAIEEVVHLEWGIECPLIPVPRTSRLFWCEHNGSKVFVRLNWARGRLDADEVIEFVDFLSRNSAPVPQIIPTRAGDLCAEVDDATVSVETDLGGEPCGMDHLEMLEMVGGGLAKIHQVSQRFEKGRAQMLDLREFVKTRMSRALSRPLPQELRDSIRRLEVEIWTTHKSRVETAVQWMTTHGDVWGPNVHTDGMRVGFTDIYCSFAPATADIAMVQLRWLMHAPTGRPLTREEMVRFLRGYLAIRELSREERDTFGVVGAAYYADKLAHYITRQRTGSLHTNYDFVSLIQSLPVTMEGIRSMLCKQDQNAA